MLRSAGGVSIPRRMSGAARAKKWTACEWMRPPRFSAVRRRTGGPRRDGAEDLVDGPRRGEVVGLGARAADPREDRRHHLDLHAAQERLEPAEVHHLEEGLCDLPVVADLDLDAGVALDTGDGVDREGARHARPPSFSLARIHFFRRNVGFCRKIGEAIA